MDKISIVVDEQRALFNSGVTMPIAQRKKQLAKLYGILKDNEQNLLDALKLDLNKSEFEGYVAELGLVYSELKYMLKNLKRLLKPSRTRVAITQMPARGYIYKEPLGVVLIISPWNYPVLLSLMPLIGAIATGNCVVLKPSNYSINVTKALIKVLDEIDSVSVVEGDRFVNQSLLDCKFDYIFFTGSEAVGKTVMEKAAKHLTPVTLELGGKSPCIVDKTANIDQSAKRIVWGKMLNSGQTCVAPDYILAHKDIKLKLIVAMRKYIKQFYGESPENNPDYPKIISRRHYDRLVGLIDRCEGVHAANANSEELKIAPAIIDNTAWSDEVMSEELFGPIIPIIEYEDINSVIDNIKSMPKPLALYLFTKDKHIERQVIANVSYGGGCINDTVLHLSSSYMPFGGVGSSGMGSYHGVKSIETLSHNKAVIKKGFMFDIPIRYAPYKNKLNLVKKIIK